MTTGQSFFLPVFWACVSGIVLLFGLAMESLSEKESFKTVKSLWRWKKIRRWGEYLVMFGVFGEIIVGGITAAREWNKDKVVLTLQEAAKDRDITEAQSNLFTILIKDYPKTPVKVFVDPADAEATKYAYKFRDLLDAAGYGGAGEGVTHLPPLGFFDAVTTVARASFSSNAVAFVHYGMSKTNTQFFPISFIGDKPVISSGLTNDVEMLHRGILACVRWAFSKTGIDGPQLVDPSLVKPGEIGILVPAKKH
jgi:hypothetical protein